jgi:hypothetical protein
MNELELWVRWTLQAARITGLLFVASVLGFLVAEVASASV